MEYVIFIIFLAILKESHPLHPEILKYDQYMKDFETTGRRIKQGAKDKQESGGVMKRESPAFKKLDENRRIVAPKKGSQAKVHELAFNEEDYKMLNFSGVLPIDETTKKLVPGGIENEVICLFDRVRKLVESNNSSLDKVESMKFRLADLNHNDIVYTEVKRYFPYPFPGLALIEVGYVLPMNASIDVEVIAHSPLPSAGYQKNIPRGREYDRLHSDYQYALDEIPGRSP